MEDYAVGESLYVFNEEGVYKKAKIISINDYREPNIKYVVDVEGEGDLVFVGEKNLARNITVLVYPNGDKTLIASNNEVKLIHLQNEESILKIERRKR